MSILSEYSIKALESFKCFEPVLSRLLTENWYFASYGSLVDRKILSIPGSWFIRLSNAFVVPDPEPPTINILYDQSGISGQLVLCCFVSSLITSSKHDFLYRFIILLHLISFFFAY